MTLRRKMALQIGASLGGLWLVIAAALWGINALHQDYGVALRGYKQLRHVFQIGSRLATARTLQRAALHEETNAVTEVQAAGVELELFRASLDSRTDADMLANVEQIGQALAAVQQSSGGEDAEAQIDASLRRVSDLAADIRKKIESAQDAAAAQRRSTLVELIAVSLGVGIAAAALGVWQYRGVMAPLSELARGVRRLAERSFADRVAVRGDGELAILAREFNRMAAELEELYRHLEQKVEQKSRELIRSERLASVGQLAAGVAHEINNPLGIISGFAELSLQQLDPAEPAHEELSHALKVICDEAFRCKQITHKLLSLARSEPSARSPLDLGVLAREVVSAVEGLPVVRGRDLKLKVSDRIGCTVIGNETELKQVVLNLLVNALEATDAAGGAVSVELTGEADVVRLVVADNGRGMSSQTLGRLFEPFFTDKRGGSGRAGTGLGLSIAHAIVQSHGGRLTAQSEGPGRGSRFVLELPLARVEAAV